MTKDYYYDFYQNNDYLEECSVAFKAPATDEGKALAAMAADMELTRLVECDDSQAYSRDGEELDDDEQGGYENKDAADVVREGIAAAKQRIEWDTNLIKEAYALLAKVG